MAVYVTFSNATQTVTFIIKVPKYSIFFLHEIISNNLSEASEKYFQEQPTIVNLLHARNK